MTDTPSAHVVFLTSPEPRVIVLTVATEGGQPLRFKISKDQLFSLNAQTADVLMRDFK